MNQNTTTKFTLTKTEVIQAIVDYIKNSPATYDVSVDINSVHFNIISDPDYDGPGVGSQIVTGATAIGELLNE